MDSSLVVLEKLNSFYSSAFSQLITITVAMIAFIGIIVPILFYLYQQRIFKIEVKSIEESINAKLIELKNEIESFTEISINDKFIKVAKNVKEDNDKLTANIFLVQANLYFTNSRYRDALLSYIRSVEYSIKGHDILNIRIAISNITNYALPFIDKEDFRENEEMEKIYKDFISDLNKVNENGMYTLEIRELNNQFRNAKNRERKKEEE